MVQSVASMVTQNRPVPSILILGKSFYLRPLVSSSIKEDVGGTYQAKLFCGNAGEAYSLVLGAQSALHHW